MSETVTSTWSAPSGEGVAEWLTSTGSSLPSLVQP